MDDLKNQLELKSEQNRDKAQDIKDLKTIVQELKKENKQLRSKGANATPDGG